MSCLSTVGHWPLCLHEGLGPKCLHSAFRLHLVESCLIFIPITLCVSPTLLTLNKVLNITEQIYQDCLCSSLLLQPAIEELCKNQVIVTLCTYPRCLCKLLSEISVNKITWLVLPLVLFKEHQLDIYI